MVRACPATTRRLDWFAGMGDRCPQQTYSGCPALGWPRSNPDIPTQSRISCGAAGVAEEVEHVCTSSAPTAVVAGVVVGVSSSNHSFCRSNSKADSLTLGTPPRRAHSAVLGRLRVVPAKAATAKRHLRHHHHHHQDMQQHPLLHSEAVPQ